MNKNQQSRSYTRTNLISGNTFSKNYHSLMIDKIKRAIAKLKRNKKEVPSELLETLKYHQGWREYFIEEIRRHMLALDVCGNPCTLIR